MEDTLKVSKKVVKESISKETKSTVLVNLRSIAFWGWVQMTIGLVFAFAETYYFNIHLNNGNKTKIIFDFVSIAILGVGACIFLFAITTYTRKEIKFLLTKSKPINAMQEHTVIDVDSERSQVKNTWRYLTRILNKNDFHSANMFMSCFLVDTMDISTLRIIVDATNPFKDCDEIIEMRNKVIELIESKIGKIH
jgi:hypothetical protein